MQTIIGAGDAATRYAMPTAGAAGLKYMIYMVLRVSTHLKFIFRPDPTSLLYGLFLLLPQSFSKTKIIFVKLH